MAQEEMGREEGDHWQGVTGKGSWLGRDWGSVEGRGSGNSRRKNLIDALKIEILKFLKP